MNGYPFHFECPLKEVKDSGRAAFRPIGVSIFAIDHFSRKRPPPFSHQSGVIHPAVGQGTSREVKAQGGYACVVGKLKATIARGLDAL